MLADDPTSPETAPAAEIRDVIELAIADNDHHNRIDYDSLHAATISGAAVPDLVHLLAELIDNAIAASAGTASKVVLLGRKSTESYLLSVVDEGGGIERSERESANATLRSAPVLANQPASSFGLSTASRLAARHEIDVTLLEATTDGIIAKVRVPAKLLEGSSAASDPNAGSADEDTNRNRRPPRSEPVAAGTVSTAGGGTAGSGDKGDDSVIDLTNPNRGGRPAKPAPTTSGA